MANVIATLIIVLVLGGAIAYIVKSKKKGVKCIGCPDSGSCAHSQSVHAAEGCGCSCCGCHSSDE